MRVRLIAAALALAVTTAGLAAADAGTRSFAVLSEDAGSSPRILEAGRTPLSAPGSAGAGVVARTLLGGMRLAQIQLPGSGNRPGGGGIVLGTPCDIDATPCKWAGLLSFKGPDGNSYLCSGQFIAPQVVLTAGHCLYDLKRRGFSSDIAFLLQYDRGTFSHEYSWRCGSKPGQYSLPADYEQHSARQKDIDWTTAAQYDYAMILVDSPSITGYFKNWAGSWKRGYWPGATRIGYPGEVMNGQLIQKTHGALFFADDIPIMPGASFPRLLGDLSYNPTLTAGTSGGGWVANLSSVEGPDNNVLVSVNSFHIPNLPQLEYGPQFDKEEFQSLLNHVASGGCE